MTAKMMKTTPVMTSARPEKTDITIWMAALMTATAAETIDTSTPMALMIQPMTKAMTLPSAVQALPFCCVAEVLL